ncbi:MAG: hypothetical protein EOO99_06040 [Pedobacter sp.]|nr:MAG: hypothetical protein EOO99_06040 [Pedobacter sp.]
MSCSSTDKVPQLQPQFKPDSTGIVFLNIEKSSVLLLKKMLESADNFNDQRLVSVYQLNEEGSAGLAEEVFPGNLEVKNEQLIFTPSKPFVPGKEYLLETYIESSFGDMEDILRGNLGNSPKPKTHILKR